MASRILLNNCALHNCAPKNTRYFWRWLTIIFNAVDKNRLQKVGPDRICAEWLLKNGAAVKWKNATEYLRDYNSLPDEENTYYIEKVDATDSAIHHIGFPHFNGCQFINDIKLVNCSYIENAAIPLLSVLKDSLENLEIIGCKNITDDGLKHVKSLNNLKHLKLGNMPYVNNPQGIVTDLKNSLPGCKIVYL